MLSKFRKYSYHACVRRPYLAGVLVGLQMCSVTAVFAVNRQKPPWFGGGLTFRLLPHLPFSDHPLRLSPALANLTVRDKDTTFLRNVENGPRNDIE
jgi:hypothetical protein